MRPLAAGALYWQEEDTLLVADLHLEKGAAFAALGMLLPPYDTRTTLERLAKVIAAVAPVARRGARRQLPPQRSRPSVSPPTTAPSCSSCSRAREWFWICGNHDPHLPASIGGTVCATLSIRGSRCGTSLRLRRRRGRSPAICTRWRASPGAGR